MNNTIVTITGQSCSGKSTLEAMLKSEGFASIISTTTRPMRVGEVNGKSYYFTSVEDFDAGLKNGEFVESVEFNGNKYGVSVNELERVFALGKPIVVIIEPNGLIQMREYAMRHDMDIYSYFLSNPTEVITKRFLTRFALEIVAVRSNVDAVLENFYPRLAVMINQESMWVHAVDAEGKEVYDEFIETFDESNLHQVAGAIVAQHASAAL